MITDNFGIYIHIPACLKKCGYCDFNTYQLSDKKISGVLLDNYVKALCHEIVQAPNRLINLVKTGENRSTQTVNSFVKWKFNYGKISTIFLGGGTPTLLSVKHLKQIFQAICNSFTIDKSAEITMEANPDTVDYDYLEQIYSLGVNRLSIGVQSFNTDILRVLDRTHNPANVLSAVNWANQIGFNISLDLIYGVPKMSLDIWQKTLKTALQLPIKHISCYALTLSDTVPLAKSIDSGQYKALDEKLVAKFYLLADKLLARAGWEWYEISNWSKGKKYRSQHNLAYWQGGQWLGFGAGAASSLANFRLVNPNLPSDYIKGKPAKMEKLNSEQLIIEKIMLQTRTRYGLKMVDLDFNFAKLANLLKLDLIDKSELELGIIVPTIKGRLLHNQLIQAFL
ncbi:MAG: radical SAM family heme chaperone HemW [Bifidobacteriaceae bacterium]|nr:radical SAM family heme chaperone HemW [Bifidobacteriaceae bacterium]